MKIPAVLLAFCMVAGAANAQIGVQLKFSRLQYIAYEPLIATVSITNRAGRDIDLRDDAGERWFGFEVTGEGGQSVGAGTMPETPPLHIEAGKTVTRKIDLSAQFPMQEFGPYHVRAHVYFADLGRYFYSPAKVVEITDARPVWKQSVGVPGGSGGETRTYSLLANRFPDHTSLYVRVEDQSRGVVYATYSLGRIIAFDEPHAEIDRENRLHVLHCSAPRTWSYALIGLNGQMLAHSSIIETKSRPHFKRTADGEVVVIGGMTETAAAQAAQKNVPKLSTRPGTQPGSD
ncbi:MAG: hypothetical protein JO354_09050 [Verrucomicrobia bacterium]|nr:hypothetical protein [Verrucomicrobiota bacterium]